MPKTGQIPTRNPLAREDLKSKGQGWKRLSLPITELYEAGAAARATEESADTGAQDHDEL